MKVVSVAAIIFAGYMLWDMWSWFKTLEQLPEGWSAAFFGFAGAVIGGFWKAIDHLTQKSKDCD